jgi:YidC/Oxa1 family membrane protein insertase
VSVSPVLGSTLGQIFHPLFEALAWLIALFYTLIPNYAIAIALLTVVVMVVTAPLTVKSTKSMVQMQKLAPELKKLQAKYKGDKQTLNEEMMKLYREHGVNPAGGCLPMFAQFPVFFVLYAVIRGLTYTVKTGHYFRNIQGSLQLCTHGPCSSPQYISHTTKLYSSLLSHNGKMPAFGIDLAAKVTGHHSFAQALPYIFLIVIAIALQYLQMRQLNSRNPQMAQANPQAQMMQRYMPLIFAVIYINIAAGVNIYFIVSSLCRIGIQEAVFRSGILTRATQAGEEVLPGRGAAAPQRRRTLMERLAEAQKRALEQQDLQKQRRAELGPGETATNGSNAQDREKVAGDTSPTQPDKPAGPAASVRPKQQGQGSSGGSGDGKPSPNGAGNRKAPQSRSKAKRGRRSR